jgi:hypothetical protein
MMQITAGTITSRRSQRYCSERYIGDWLILLQQTTTATKATTTITPLGNFQYTKQKKPFLFGKNVLS